MSDQIYFFDTTLRDGEQCPGASMNLREKLEVARQMERLGMDVIEAGFPCISDGDFEAVHTIAREIKKCRIAGLARCVKADIEAAARALEPAGERARIHIFLATSKLHMQFKLKKAESEILRMAAEGVSYAKQFVQDVEFSPEDASRTDLDFLTKVVETVIDAGATTVNIPDTVGYTTPDEFYRIIRHLKENVPNIGKAVISVHCHNDLGLAVANSLAAVRAGARQVEGTINGIGERAGNVALEEVIMALRTRAGQFGDVTDNINTKEIVRTSRIVARMSGMQVQRSKAIVGENAFAHSSGIHQHGILNCRETYEVMDPQAVGWGATELPLTKHSGRAAVKSRLEQLGHVLTEEEVNTVFERFKKVGDSKKFVYDDDLSAIVDDSLHASTGLWELDFLQFVAGSHARPTATVGLLKEGKKFEDSSTGNGAVDAVIKAIERITKRKGTLKGYSVNAASEGKDALGEVTVHVDFGQPKPIVGKGASTDVIEASARAYLNAVNRSIRMENMPRPNNLDSGTIPRLCPAAYHPLQGLHFHCSHVIRIKTLIPHHPMKATPLLLCLACSALAAPPAKKQPEPAEPLPALEKNTIAIDGHPESVAADAEGNIYFTCIGSRLTPTEKDKDGYLGVIPHGSTEPKKITDVDTLDAPKGLLYQDGFLYCTDVDMVFKINAKTGAIEGYVDLSPSRMKFLNDLAFINGRLMVSSTDTNQIFYVDTNTSSYGELVTKQPIYKPNGLAWDPERKVIYLCEYATDEKGKPSGRLLSINPVSREVTELSKERGQYDGLVYRDNALYYSDWSKDKKPEAVRRLDLKTGRSAPVATGPVEGAADFILYDSMMVVPGMTEKKIHIMPIGGKK